MKRKTIAITLVAVFAVFGGLAYYLKSQRPKQKAESGAVFDVCEAHGFREGECYQCEPSLLEKFRATHDWCVEHNLPESQCIICDPFAKFKAKGDWCKEHSMPESQCIKCNPSLATSQQTFIDWCPEHGVPESQCTSCKPSLRFSTKSDWCQEHNVRDSECVLCHPELKAKQENVTKEAKEWCEHGFAVGDCFRCDASLKNKFTESGDWCGGHSVPESQCFKCQHGLQETIDERLKSSTGPKEGPQETGKWCEHGFEIGDCFRCNASLEQKFKKTGDWCGGHSVPESQCFKCQHGLQETVDERLKVSTIRKDLLEQRRAIQVELEKELPAGAFCGIHLLRIKLSSKEMASTIGLRYHLARKRKVTETVKCNAEAIYNQDELVEISSRFDGTINTVNVKLGQYVKKGQILAVIDSPELGALRSNLQLENDLLALEESLFKDTLSLIDVLKGNSLSPSEAAKKVSAFQVGEAKAELLELVNEIKSSEKTLAIEQKLKQEGLGLEAKFINAQKNYTGSLSKFRASLEEVSLNARKSLLTQRGKVARIKQKIGNAGLSNPVSDSAYVIQATQNGTIIAKSMVMGEVVEAGKTLGNICNLEKMWIKIALRPEDATKVRIDQHVEFTPRGGRSQEFFGQVTWLGSEVDEKTRMVSALAEVDSSKALLRNNSFGKTRIHIHRNENVVVVPKAALQWEGCCHVVFVKMGDDIFAPRKVKLGYEGNDFYVVESGLMEGEQVVTQGSFLLKTEVLKSSIGAGCTD